MPSFYQTFCFCKRSKGVYKTFWEIFHTKINFFIKLVAKKHYETAKNRDFLHKSCVEALILVIQLKISLVQLIIGNCVTCCISSDHRLR